MSKNKGFSDTSASRYSLALYELAVEAKMLSDIEDHAAQIINLIFLSEDFKSLKVQNSLAKIIEKFKFPTGMKLTVDVDPINFN